MLRRAGAVMRKPRLAMYWASACGGCEVSLLNIPGSLPAVADRFELVFCPCLADVKYEDLRAFPDGHIDLCLFNGAIRSSENRDLAHVLRRKSGILVAFGSCAHEGCVPGLANLTTAAELLETVYRDSPSADNPRGVVPGPCTLMPEGPLELPDVFDTVRTLDQVERVDYYVPGCPPESPRVLEALELLAASLPGGAGLPARGSVLGALAAPVCRECPREKPSRQIERFLRVHEVAPDPTSCLLDQGLICMGVATRGGCGALCPRAGMGCRGCYGAPEGVPDQGAAMVSALAAMIGAGASGMQEDRLKEAVESAMATVADPAGTFCRYSLAHSLLQRARMRRAAGAGEAGR